MQNRRNGRRMNLPNSDTVLVRIEYTVPASEQDLAATAAVLEVPHLFRTGRPSKLG